MRLFSKTVLTVSAIFSLGMSGADASVYYWQSEDKRVEVSFADDWQRIHNQRPSDILTIKAPGAYDFATCTISARSDERFKIYPAHFAQHIQKLHVSEDMWKLHFDGQVNPVFHEVRDHAGIGRGFASMASVSYETSVGPKMMKRSVAFASLYGNTLYTVECSAQEDAYSRWHNRFMSFIKAVEFVPTTNHALSGYYRDFIDDSVVPVKGPTVFDDTYR